MKTNNKVETDFEKKELVASPYYDIFEEYKGDYTEKTIDKRLILISEQKSKLYEEVVLAKEKQIIIEQEKKEEAPTQEVVARKGYFSVGLINLTLVCLLAAIALLADLVIKDYGKASFSEVIKMLTSGNVQDIVTSNLNLILIFILSLSALVLFNLAIFSLIDSKRHKCFNFFALITFILSVGYILTAYTGLSNDINKILNIIHKDYLLTIIVYCSLVAFIIGLFSNYKAVRKQSA